MGVRVKMTTARSAPEGRPTRSALQRPAGPDAGVTDILGSVLLVAITVVFAAGFMYLLLSLPPPTSPTDAVIETFVLPTNNDRLVLEHRGGSPIPLMVLGVTVEINGVPTRVTVGERLAAADPAWSVVTPSGVSKNAGADFVTGDQVRYTDSTLPGKAVSILVLQTSTGAVVLSGATAQQSDTTAPQLQSARTTSTTTIQVNFTEPLRTIDKADFTVSVPTVAISAVVLLGNGSAAEFTTASFATSDVPTVNRIGTPTGTRDVAGNLLAGTASVVSVDGVAPTISSLSSGSPGQTSATITFTTDEAASSNVTFGPTPSLTGRWATGTSTTSHSLSLTSLTAGTQYHYKVTAVDALGNNNTAEAFRTFTTTAITGGSGGGGGSAPNYLQFNATQVTVARGTASGSFTVTLLNGTGHATAPSNDLYVTLITNSTQGYFVNDTDPTVRIAGVVIPTSTPSQNFKFISYDAGSHPAIVAVANNTVAAAHQIAVTGTNPSPPFIQPPSLALNFTTAPATVARGTASTNFTVTLKNTTGATVTAPAEINVTLVTNSTSGYFLDALAGTTRILTVPIAAAASSANFKYVDYNGGTQSVIMAVTHNATPEATVIAVTGTNPSPPFIQPPSNYLNFSTAPASVARGTASTTFTLTLKNTTGSTVTTPTELIVTLASNSTSGFFVSNADGTTLITHVTIAAAASTASFKYIDYAALSNTVITAYAANTTPAAAVIAITGTNPGPYTWNYLQFSGVVSTLARATVSVNYTLTLRNSFGSAVSPDSPPLTITLLTNSTTGYFLNASDGTTLITTISLGTGSSSAQFKYIDYSGGTRTVLAAFAPNVTSVATAVSITGTNPAPVFFQPPPYYLDYTTVVSSVAKDTVTTSFTITLKNSTGTASSPYAPPLTIYLSTNSTRGVFLNDTDGTTIINSITIGTASTTASFKYKDGQGGATSMLLAVATNTTAAMTPITITGTPPSSGGSGDGIGPPPPYYLEFTTSNTTLLPGMVSTSYTVTLRTTDGGGAASPVSPPLTITLETNSTIGYFLNATDGTTPITTVTIGTASTSANFKYVDWRGGAKSVLTASATNTTAARLAVTVTNKGNVFAENGDSVNSVQLRLVYTAEQEDANIVQIGLTIVNPTPSDYDIDLVRLFITPLLATNNFFTTASVAGGTDDDLEACSLTGSGGSDVTCNPAAAVTLKAYSMKIFMLSFTTASTTTAGSTELFAQVNFSSPSISITGGSQNVRHNPTGANLNIFGFDGTDTVTGFQNRTAATAQQVAFRWTMRADAITANTRLWIPIGWAVSVPPQGASNGTANWNIRDPTPWAPGWIDFSVRGVADNTTHIIVIMTPPNNAGALYEFLVETRSTNSETVTAAVADVNDAFRIFVKVV